MHCGDLPEGAGAASTPCLPVLCLVLTLLSPFFPADQKKSSDLVHERQPAGSCAGIVCYCTVGSSGKAAYGCGNCAVSVASDTGTSRKMIGTFNGLQVDLCQFDWGGGEGICEAFAVRSLPRFPLAGTCNNDVQCLNGGKCIMGQCVCATGWGCRYCTVPESDMLNVRALKLSCMPRTCVL